MKLQTQLGYSVVRFGAIALGVVSTIVFAASGRSREIDNVAAFARL